MTASICLHDSDRQSITAYVLTPKDEKPFITLAIGDLFIYLPGYGASCADAAREMAAALVKTAEEVDALVAAHPAVDQPEAADARPTELVEGTA